MIPGHPSAAAPWLPCVQGLSAGLGSFPRTAESPGILHPLRNIPGKTVLQLFRWLHHFKDQVFPARPLFLQSWQLELDVYGTRGS